MTSENDTLPELTLALRTLGSRRHRRGDGYEHERFFAPLLEARRGAERAPDFQAAIMAFDPVRLGGAFDKTLRLLATERAPSSGAPARRALEARLQERIEPLRDALTLLGERADALLVADAPSRSRATQEWWQQLQHVFACADRCWPSVADALAAPSPRRRGWLGRLFGRRRA